MLEIREIGDVAVARFKATITIANVGNLREKSLSEQITGNTDKSNVILNMTGVEYLDSGALGRIVGIYKAVKARKGTFALCCLTEEMENLIAMVGLHKILEVFKTEEEAVDSLSS